jgi:Calcineurin-like phosphoesterase
VPTPAEGVAGEVGPEAPAAEAVAEEPVVEAQQCEVESRPIPEIPPVVEVEDLDWDAIRGEVLARRADVPLASVVERLETMLASPPALMFDDFRSDETDRAIHVKELDDAAPLWIIGDIHGDLLALEASLALIRREATDGVVPRIIFLGDFFDDGGDGLQVLVRVLDIVLSAPASTCIVIGNHEEALGYDGARFTATVSPSDFSDMLNTRLDDAPLVALGKLAIQLFARLPRALFLADGLFVTHGGFPLTDLHEELRQTSAWNDERCLADYTWTRAHPRARKKIPNRMTRGSQFGYEDFAAFCALSTELGRPLTHMVRGHDHVDERYEIYPAYRNTPVLTTVALSRRLPRELMGPYVRVPSMARWTRGALPQVHRLHVPEAIVRELYPEIMEEEVTAPPTPAEPTEGASE